MADSNWQRARSTEQIEARIREILGAAVKLFKSKPFDKITMQMIARESHFSQSNLARYFGSKEEIFLTIYLEDLKAWQEDAEKSLRPDLNPGEFAAIWTEVYCRQRRMMELSPLLAVTLERNSSEDVYRKTKSTVKRIMEEGIMQIASCVPKLNPEQAAEALLFFNTYATGLYPITIHSAMQEKVLDELDFNAMKFDFKNTLEAAFRTYLKGLLAGS